MCIFSISRELGTGRWKQRKFDPTFPKSLISGMKGIALILKHVFAHFLPNILQSLLSKQQCWRTSKLENSWWLARLREKAWACLHPGMFFWLHTGTQKGKQKSVAAEPVLAQWLAQADIPHLVRIQATPA